MSDATPAFTVGRVPIYGRLILAPMAGYADVPHRAVCQAQGSAMQYTEFVAAEMILAGDRYTWGLLKRRKGERPFTIQLFSNDPRKLLAAAQKVESLEPDIIDVNMGCSTRKVSGRGAGVGLMRRPELVAETFRLLTRHLTLPVTGKIRLGWEENRNYLEIARIMEDNGAALVAIHPRTKEQKYGGRLTGKRLPPSSRPSPFPSSATGTSNPRPTRSG
jgi:tRNA-dihydrouridine synthase B